MYFTTSTSSPGKTVEYCPTKLPDFGLYLQHIYHLSAHLPSTNFMIRFGLVDSFEWKCVCPAEPRYSAQVVWWFVVVVH